MLPARGYRELRKCRASVAGQTYFVTTCCAGREARLSDGRVCEVILTSLGDMLTRGVARLDGYVIMPDHVHLIIELASGHELSAVMREFKKFTGLRGNALQGRRGAFWQDGYHEHAVRGLADWRACMEYMLNNPVRAGLATKTDEYRWAKYGPWEANGVGVGDPSHND